MDADRCPSDALIPEASDGFLRRVRARAPASTAHPTPNFFPSTSFELRMALNFDAPAQGAALSREELEALKDNPKQCLVPKVTERKPGALPFYFTEVTKDNVGQVRILNEVLFPVEYSEKFYKDLYQEELHPIIHLCKHRDLAIGTIASRIETFDPSIPDPGKGTVEADASAAEASKRGGGGGKKRRQKKSAAGGSQERPKRIYIMTLGVLPAYRRFGLGSKLLASVIGYALPRPEIRYLYLHVQTNNAAALRFYQQFGFRITHKIEGYYKQLDPPDCYVLRKDLNPERPNLVERSTVIPDFTQELEGLPGASPAVDDWDDFGPVSGGGKKKGKSGKKKSQGSGGGGGGKKRGGGKKKRRK